MKKLKKISIFITLFLLPLFALAQGETGGATFNIHIPNPLEQKGINTLLGLLNIILRDIIMPIAAVFVVVWIIYAGFTYVTAQGNETKIKAAHQRLLWSLVGAVILLGAAGISAVVQNTVNGLIK